MKTLLILRHAKSSWKEEGIDDHERSLNKRGKRDAPRIGKLLREKDLVPDLILTSSAERARKTTELVAQESSYEGDIIVDRNLYAAYPETIFEVLNKVENHFERIMIVGHNPGLEELLEVLTGEVEPLPTGALAEVSFEIERWSELDEDVEGKLKNIYRPREF